VRVDGTGDVSATNAVWKTLRQVPVMSSPVLVGEDLYWVSDEGMATCARAGTGEILWQERLGGLHLASLLHAEGRVYVFSQEGTCSVLRAGPTFERLAENRLPGPLIATPAVADGGLFVRTDSDLYHISGGR